jgi:hypothetical protein
MTIQQDRELLEEKLSSIFESIKTETDNLLDEVFLIYSITEKPGYFELINEAIIIRDALEDDYGLILNIKLSHTDRVDLSEIELMIFNGDGLLVEDETYMINLYNQAELEFIVRETRVKANTFLQLLKNKIT